ncbi:MAG: flagellar hook-length control protein FliK [Coprococcus sp.]|nr:flagellar hook-length control protein FliK [Coprococcus sp.]
MNMLNVGQSLNLNQKTTKSQKSGNNSGEVKDDFKNLLQGKNEETKEVSKETKDTVKKPEETEEAPVKETEKDEKVQPDGLLAAYQMSQNLRPEMIQAQPEEPEAVMPEEPVVLGGVEVEMPVMETVQTVDEKHPEMIQERIPEEAESFAETFVKPEVAEVAADISVKMEAKVSETETRKGPAKSRNEETENFQNTSQSTQQTAVVPESPARSEMHPEAPKETVTVQVRQPEELPEQVTGQIVTKMENGIDEFEIHIEPENLGKIAVKISYQQGEANVSLICSEKKAVEILGNNLKEICGVIEHNFGGNTTVIVEKPENDYLNQARDESGQGRQEAQQEHNKEGRKEQNEDDAEQFIQKLRLGLAGFAG